MWLQSKASIRASFCKNLHAKCFLNESEALITSMNLYEFSQVNNEEMGVVVSKETDPTLYAAVYEEAMRLIRVSDEIRVTVEKVAKKETPPTDRVPTRSRSKVSAPQKGVCIRCNAEIAANPSRPYCNDCYRIWQQYENTDYKEKHCHICGVANESTLNKPTCYTCYRKYKTVFSFPSAS